MPEAYIIHSPADDAAAKSIRNALVTAGIDAWVDHVDCEAERDDWPRQAREALETCQCALYLLTAQSAVSAACRSEASTVIGTERPLLIVSMDAVRLDNFPEPSPLVQYFDLTHNREANWGRLVQAIKTQHATSPPPAAGDPPGPYITGDFPHWLAHQPIVGRSDDLLRVQEALTAGQRATVIMGLSGVGKTRLAVEVVANARFRHGTIWHTLTEYTTLDDLTMLIRNHLRLGMNTDAGEVWEELGRRQVLLVLDNAEECVAHRHAYTQRLNRLDLSGGTRILMTSRQRWPALKDARTYMLRVPELGVAVAVVRAMVKRNPPSYSVKGQEETIARAAHCRPKLIEYALRWADSYPLSYVQQILSTLQGVDAEQAFDDMVLKTIRLAEQHEDWPKALNALRRLAICQGSIMFEAAQAIIGDPYPLSLLRNWGLISFEDQRYTIDPLLTAHIDLDTSAGAAHFSYFLAFAEQCDERQDYQSMDAESENLTAAFNWALESDEPEEALRMANACSGYLANRGLFDERKNWYTRIVARLVTTADETPQDYAQASAQLGLGIAYNEHLKGDRPTNLESAEAIFNRALRFFTPQRYPTEYAITQNNLGITYRMRAELNEPIKNLNLAIACFSRAVNYMSQQTAPLDFAVIQSNLGAAHLSLAGYERQKDNLRRAITLFRRALAYLKPDNLQVHYAVAHANMGIAYAGLAVVDSPDRRAYHFRKAIEAFRHAEPFLTQKRAPVHFARLLFNLGNVYRDIAAAYGDPENLRKAAAAYSHALTIWTAEKAPILHAMTQSNIGHVYLELAEQQEPETNRLKAIEAFQQALELYSPRLHSADRIRIHVPLGIAYHRLGHHREAHQCWREAEAYFRSHGDSKVADLIARIIASNGHLGAPRGNWL